VVAVLSLIVGLLRLAVAVTGTEKLRRWLRRRLLSRQPRPTLGPVPRHDQGPSWAFPDGRPGKPWIDNTRPSASACQRL
jgi:hypothetical protein